MKKSCKCCGKVFNEVPKQHKVAHGLIWFQCTCDNTLVVKVGKKDG